jgi:hypothetical protein
MFVTTIVTVMVLGAAMLKQRRQTRFTMHPKITESTNKVNAIFDQYSFIEQMKYCNHPFDTQTNESLNQSIARVAPKSVCYSGMNSLNSCIAMVIGIHNLGYQDFFSKVFEALAVTPSSC